MDKIEAAANVLRKSHHMRLLHPLNGSHYIPDDYVLTQYSLAFTKERSMVELLFQHPSTYYAAQDERQWRHYYMLRDIDRELTLVKDAQEKYPDFRKSIDFSVWSEILSQVENG